MPEELDDSRELSGSGSLGVESDLSACMSDFPDCGLESAECINDFPGCDADFPGCAEVCPDGTETARDCRRRSGFSKEIAF